MKTLATFTALIGLSAALAAADPPPTIDISKLPGTMIDDVVVPVPREVFLSLDKLGDQDWNAQIMDSKFDKLGDRRQVALLFGVVVADGFVAVQAENRDAVTDIGRHVSRLAKALGVSDAVTAHANAIIDYAETDDWDAVRSELALGETLFGYMTHATGQGPVEGETAVEKKFAAQCDFFLGKRVTLGDSHGWQSQGRLANSLQQGCGLAEDGRDYPGQWYVVGCPIGRTCQAQQQQRR